MLRKLACCVLQQQRNCIILSYRELYISCLTSVASGQLSNCVMDQLSRWITTSACDHKRIGEGARLPPPAPSTQGQDNGPPQPRRGTSPRSCTSRQLPFCWHRRENRRPNLQQLYAKCNLHSSAGSLEFHCERDLPDRNLSIKPHKEVLYWRCRMQRIGGNVLGMLLGDRQRRRRRFLPPAHAAQAIQQNTMCSTHEADVHLDKLVL